jgi:hypothetical protein
MRTTGLHYDLLIPPSGHARGLATVWIDPAHAAIGGAQDATIHDKFPRAPRSAGAVGFSTFILRWYHGAIGARHGVYVVAGPVLADLATLGGGFVATATDRFSPAWVESKLLDECAAIGQLLGRARKLDMRSDYWVNKLDLVKGLRAKAQLFERSLRAKFAGIHGSLDLLCEIASTEYVRSCARKKKPHYKYGNETACIIS